MKCLLTLIAMAAATCCATEVKDFLTPPEEGDSRLTGAVGGKLDRFIAHRVCGDFAKQTIFPEARSVFEKPDDDLFNLAPGTSRPQGMWKGEFWGKLMISACRIANYTHDAALRTFLHEEGLRLVAFQKPDGYLGSYADPEYVQPIDWKDVQGRTDYKGYWCWNLWCRKYTMWGLLMNWKLTGDRKILDAVCRSMDQEIAMLKKLGLHPCDTGTFCGMPSSSVLKPLLMLYRETGNANYFDFAKMIVDDFRLADGRAPNLIANAFSGQPVADWYKGPWAWAKAYEMMSCLDGLLEYYRVTGEESVLEAMKRVQAMLAEHETNPCFSVGYNDQFANAASLLNGITEPCDAIHWIRFNHDLWLLTGETKYVDAIELTFYNAYLAGMYRDGTWGARGVRSHGYHQAEQGGQSGMTHQHCCVNNMPRTIVDVAQTIAAKDADDVLYVAFYNDGFARLGDDRVKISGNYPVGEKVTVKIRRAKAGLVKFRIPAWSASDLDRGTWRTVQVPVGESTHELSFDLRPRLWAPKREATTYAPPETDGRQEWRVRMWTCYGRNPDLIPCIRTQPAAEVMRGPLLLAKSLLAGASADDLSAGQSVYGTSPQFELIPRTASETWGAWTLRIAQDGEIKDVPVCDFPSVGDDYKTDGLRFNVWF